MYTRFPSTTSTKSSAVAFGRRITTSAFDILYSLKITLILLWPILARGTVFAMAIPPLSIFRTMIAGGFFNVQSDPKAFEFRFDYFLVTEGFEYVQDDED